MNFTEFKNHEDSERPHLLLLGHPVSHSLSPLMHNTAAEYYGFPLRYIAIDLRPEEFDSVAAHFNSEYFRGANITIPYKEVLLEFVDHLDDSARRIGAMNTIYHKDAHLVGANTDLYGFLRPLEEFRERMNGTTAIVFGTGGASKAIVAGLLETGVSEIILISRNPVRDKPTDNRVAVKGYGQWAAYTEGASIVVNTTPLGMDPDIDSSPVRQGEASLLKGKICYDIVYKPQKTRFLALAEEAGAETIGGLDMLIYQGSEAFELWTGRPFPVETIQQKLHDYFR